MKTHAFFALLPAVLLAACATTPNPLVIPRENNQYDTVGIGKTRIIALNQAMQSVNTTCRSKGGNPVVISDETRYNGVVSEETGRLIERVGSAVGAIAGIASPNISRDDDYQVTVHFRCNG
jgi:ABC-type Fe3+-hydroxamate transport system substrate-binding protein